MVELNLVLFFTRGVSLYTWEQMGILDREVALYKRLQNYGIRISFVTYGNAEDLNFAGRLSDIHILCNRWGLPKRYYEQFLPWIHAWWLNQADVNKNNQIYGAEAALRAAQLWRKPLISRCGYMWSEFNSRQYGLDSTQAQHSLKIENEVFRASQRIVVTTPAMKQDIEQRIPFAFERTIVIPNYVDTAQFKPVQYHRDTGKCLFIGRLAKEKNVEALLEAIQPLDLELIIIGNGELRSELQSRFGSMNGRVHWKGVVPHSELPTNLNQASLFILPSHFEGQPKALIEAMACGIAVIGADSPGIRELISHGETGWLCSNDPVSIREAILELMSKPDLCEEIGINARKFVVENFSLDRIVDLELALLHEVANESS